ncbi:PREDICTED: serpin-ZX-like [Camelina sativa]|uniref:Serpin-ZX-like n=1 Tax=Camelina sativa TaxID=90675 RepID=A0ABM0ZB30_CAMSA|nr:PREDICTED: serpin-ZX-like [Camelina sativa]
MDMDLKESQRVPIGCLTDLKKPVGNQHDIALRLAQHVINTTAGKTSNLVFSPALINVILSFVAARSPGDTAEQIVSLLQASSTDELHAVSSRIVTTVLADSTAIGGPTILAANGFWIEKSLFVKPSFKDLLLNSYKAAFKEVDFLTKADEVTKEVNSWVEEQTNGLITNLLPPNSASDQTDHIFANALFFNGKWVGQFDPSLTKDSDFHLLDGTKVRVPFMTRSSFGFHLDVFEGFKVLDLKYRGPSLVDCRIFSMQIYLPDEKDGLPAMLERLASTRGFFKDNKVLPSHRGDIGELKIPRFKFAFDFEASKALKAFGLEVPSSKIFHKSCIEVDEVGSKAAAAAALRGAGGCGFRVLKKYDFVADHPFLFLIKEHRSGLVLFLGQVMDPSMH